MSFLAELKRRNVFRVAIAYGVTAWLLAQVADLLLANFGAPDWVMKVFLLALILGFPVALVLAWALELTPEGLRREDSAATASPAERRGNAQRLNQLIIVLLVLAVGWLSWDRFLGRRSVEPAPGPEPVAATPGTSAASVDDPMRDPSIAVLPFVNLSDEQDNEYFADGLSEELLNLLVQIPELKVAARTSSFSFKGKDVTVGDIAGTLGVSHVLEGSVRKAGDRVRITAQLIEADEGFHLWSDSFDRRLDDIFAVQDEIAGAVVEALKVNLLGSELPHRETSAEAYALYLRGLYFFNKVTAEGRAKSIEMFRQALVADPGYARAMAQLAAVYLYQANNGERPFEAGFELGRDTALRAIELDPATPAAWGVLGYIQAYYDWNWEVAAGSIAQLLELDSNSASSLNGAATFENMLGRFDRALELRAQAIRLDPLNGLYPPSQAFTLMTVGEFDRAAELLRETLSLFPDHPFAGTLLAKALLLDGEAASALEILDSLASSAPAVTWKAMALYSLGRDDEATAVMRDFFDEEPSGNPLWYAQFHAWRGEHDAAFEYLDRAIDLRWRSLAYILGERVFFTLHDDPRWEAIVERIGLLEAWRQVPPEHGGPGA